MGRLGQRVAQRIFHLICAREYSPPTDYDDRFFQKGFSDTDKFIHRFGGRLDFQGKRVLDVGSGFGSTCIYMALNGAAKVVGVDIDPHRVEFANAKLTDEYRHLADRVTFKEVSGRLGELGDETFDVIVSKDSFEHIADPETYVFDMEARLRNGGVIAIGFGPLWKSPYGGHMTFMTKLPWAHLLFPELVIMHERKRLCPGENAESFAQIVGGLNKMTLERFLNIMATTQLEPIYFAANASQHPLAGAFDLFRRASFLREYLTFNLYGIWQRRSS